MVEPLSYRPNPAEDAPKPQGGVRVTFVNPELLRAYILDPSILQASSLAERMSGIRERNLGELHLDGQLFRRMNLTLVVEPDRDQRGKKPTAIIRADLQLGNGYSGLKELQQTMAENPVIGFTDDAPDPSQEIFDKLGSPFRGEKISLIEFSKNLAYIYGPLERGTHTTTPLAILQLWDKDSGAGSISISLVSYDRYHHAWMTRRMELGRQSEKGWEVDADEADRWLFNEAVGIDVDNPKVFRGALNFYEEAFTKAMRSLYLVEGIDAPNLNLVIEPPLVFKEKEMVTFEDIGGQSDAVQYLRGFAALEKRSQVIGRRSVLLAGPPGNGKSSLVQAFATELGVPLVKKTTLDLPPNVTEADVRNLLEAGFLEAKSAAKIGGGKAVFCLEGLEAFLGEDARLHDFLLNKMDVWEEDPEVILIATSNFPGQLHPGIISRFAGLDIFQPKMIGLKEILHIHIARIAKLLGRDIFAGIDLDRVARRMATFEEFSGRAVVKFLSGAYSLARVQSQEMTTEFLLSQLPDRGYGLISSARRS